MASKTSPAPVQSPAPAPVPAPTPTPSAMQGAQQAAAAAAAATPSPVPAPTPTAPCPKCEPKREVTSITMHRRNISLTGGDKYGHWWTKIGDDESYGWWPAEPLNKGGVLGSINSTLGAIGPTLTGVKGSLNGLDEDGNPLFGDASPTRDPHHDDTGAEEQFHPKVSVCDKRTDDEIKDCIRGYAKSYSGEWRWTFGFGQNCHTFQEGLMEHCGLSE